VTHAKKHTSYFAEKSTPTVTLPLEANFASSALTVSESNPRMLLKPLVDDDLHCTIFERGDHGVQKQTLPPGDVGTHTSTGLNVHHAAHRGAVTTPVKHSHKGRTNPISLFLAVRGEKLQQTSRR
jgi:hypothetical protein